MNKQHKEIAKILKRNYNVYPSDKLFNELADYFKLKGKERTEWLKGCGVEQ